MPLDYGQEKKHTPKDFFRCLNCNSNTVCLRNVKRCGKLLAMNEKPKKKRGRTRLELAQEWMGVSEPEWCGWPDIEEMIRRDGERLLVEEYPIYKDGDRR